jgi:serine/threonine protein kinase
MLAMRNGRTCAVLMDFGLASEVSRATDVTRTGVTKGGALIGTPNYMAPEQFEGGTLSPATDVYALGVVLYEMLTGKQPFAAATPIAAAVQRGRRLKPASSLQPCLPRQWDDIIGKCLEFKAEERYQSAAELQRQLELLQAGGIKLGYLRASSLLRRIRRVSPLKLCLSTLFVGILVSAAAFAVWHFYPRTQPFTSISIEQITDTGDITDVAMFPDGKMLAEAKSDDGQNSVWVRNIPTNTDTQVLAPSPLDYFGLTISPDGNRLYFVRQDAGNSHYANLYTLSVLGGIPRELVHDIAGPASFSPDGKHIVYMRIPQPRNSLSSELHIADQNGENDEVLSKNSGFSLNASYSPVGSEVAWVQLEQTGPVLILLHLKSRHQDRISMPHRVLFINNVSWLPDGKHLLLNVDLPPKDNRMFGFAVSNRMFGQFAVMKVPSDTFRRITDDTASYRGLTIAADASTFATIIFNEASRVDYFRTSDGIMLTSNSSRHSLDDLNWIDDQHIALSDLSGDEPGITLIDRDTGTFNSIDMGKAGFAPAGLTSCQGDQLVFVRLPRPDASAHESQHLYGINIDGTGISPLAGTDGAYMPICIRGSKLVYYAIQEPGKGNASAWAVPLEGGTPRKVMDLPSTIAPIYSSDGKTAACQVESGGRWSVIIKDLSNQRTLRELDLKGFHGGDALHFSRDDKAVVYVQNLGPELALVYQPIDGSSPHVISTVGHDPVKDFAWSPSGKQLAVLRSISTSDVALISDKSTKPRN